MLAARLRRLVMASVDTEQEFYVAQAAGWRTFRVRRLEDPLLLLGHSPLEFVCPASDESGHKTTCERCQLCRGLASPARSVAILAHGKSSTMRAWRVP